MGKVLHLPPPAAVGQGMRGYAYAYASMGWRVFPVHEISPAAVDGMPSCSCSAGAECDRPGKHPRTAKGVTEATTEPAQIEAWWGRWPNASIGVATGRESGITVIDADASKGKPGVANLTILTATHGGIPKTGAFVVNTGGGGLHLYFNYTPALPTGVNVLAEGVDVRNDGGYVIAPPSGHASGGSYKWAGEQKGQIGSVPEWLLPGATTRAEELGVGEAKKGRKKTAQPFKLEKVQSMLKSISPEDRDRWLKVGVILGRMYLGTAAEQEAWATYENWSARSSKFDENKAGNLARMKEMFHEESQTAPRTGSAAISVGSLVTWAREGGWEPFGDRKTIAYEPGAEAAIAEALIEAVVTDPNNTFFNVMGEVRDVQATPIAVVRIMEAAAQRGEPPPETLVVRRSTTHGLLSQFTERAVIIVRGKDGLHEALAIPEKLATIALKQKAPHFPTLSGVAEWPMVGLDGKLINKQHGYDSETGLYFDIARNVKIDEWLKPEAALQFMFEEFFCDFPFEEDEDRAAALGLAIAFMQRPLMKTAPAFAIVAPQPGTGKSTLVEVLSLAIHGGPMTSHAFSSDEEELRKAVHSLMVSKTPAVLFDNIGRGRTVDSDHLAKLLTSEISTDRTLGASETRKEVNSLLVCFTGNNIAFAHDMASRVMTIRLNAKTANPLTRSFTHSDLRDWALEQRNKVLSAVISICRAGCAFKLPPGPPSRFEDFDARIVRAVMRVTGVDIRCRLDTGADSDSEEDSDLRAVIELIARWQEKWRTALNGQAWRVSELMAAIDAKTFDDSGLKILMRAVGQQAWEKDPKNAVGKMLRLLNGDHKFEPLLLRSKMDTDLKVNKWHVDGAERFVASKPAPEAENRQPF